jgi:PAS domain-containing protein
MINFKDTGPNLIKSTDPGLQLGDIKAPEIEISEKKLDYDYRKEMEDMLKGAQEQKVDQAVELAISDFDIGDDWKGIAKLDEVEKYLRQAKEFISGKEYKKALKTLEKLLELDFAHHEAIYLKAYCQVQLKQDMQALRTLAPIRKANLESTIQSRLEVLKHKIRSVIMTKILFESLADIAGKQSSKINSKLRELIQLDPEFGFYYYILTVNYMNEGRLNEALEVVNRGIRETITSDRVRLMGLKKYIERLLLNDLLRPVVLLFKQAKYRRARSELKRINGVYKDNPLLTTFDNYLKKIDPGVLSFLSRRQKEFPPPSGKPEDVNDLYFLLVEDEINRSFELIRRRKVTDAEILLKRARGYTPAFPYINYILSGFMYQRLTIQMLTASIGLDTLIADLYQARIYAKIGTGERKNHDAADLLDAINSLYDKLIAAQKAVKKRQQEESLANSAIEEFKDIMDSGRDGIKNEGQLVELHRRMSALNKKIHKLRKQVESPDIANAIDQLDEAVKRNLQQLNTIANDISEQKREVELIDSISKEFQSIMNSAKDGIRTSSQFDGVVARFKSLKKEIGKVKKKVKIKEHEKILEQIDDSVDKNLQQLNPMRNSVHDNEIIDRYIVPFNTIMKSLNSGNVKLSSRKELNDFIDLFRNMKSRAESDKWNLHSRDAKKTIDDLIKSIDDVLSQFERY